MAASTSKVVAAEEITVTVGGATAKKSYVVHTFPANIPLATVEVGVGLTKNMGDYNSLKVDVRVKRNCLDCEPAIQDTQKKLYVKVVAMLDEVMKHAESKGT